MSYLGHDRFADNTDDGPNIGWLVSYADMMTIILTFMILLLSISTIAQTKYDLLVQAFTGERQGNLHEVQDRIDQIVEEQALSAEIKTFLDDDGLKIEFSNALLFDTGSAALRDQAAPVFDPIKEHLARELKPHYGLIIQGYTDDVPISSGRFRSNWELSTSRAIHVMEALAQAGLDKRRMSVQGFADTRPAAEIDLLDIPAIQALTDSELAEIRAANRRVVIRIDTLPPERVDHLQNSNSPVVPKDELLHEFTPTTTDPHEVSP